MNVLVLHGTSDLYGGSRIIYSVVKMLKEAGHHPVVVLSEEGPLALEFRKVEVEVLIIRLAILRRKYFSLPGIFDRIRVARKAWKQLNALVRTRPFDLIYSNTTGVIIGAFVARHNKIPHVWHVHEIITKPAVFGKAVGFLLNKYSDKVIVVSEAVKQHWQTWVNPEKLIRIYNGIETEEFENTRGRLKQELGISSDQLLIGMIGRVNHWKGQSYFIQIAKKISFRFPEVRFLMVGDPYPGNEYLVDELNKSIFSEGLQNVIYNIGYRTDISNILNSLDIFVAPSILPDPFPTVILEAMAATKPIVATSQGGAKEMLVDGETGILIPLNDVETASLLLGNLITDSAKRRQLAVAGNVRLHTYFTLIAFNNNIRRQVEALKRP